MSCCAPGAEAVAGLESGAGALPSREELLLASRAVDGGQREVRLSVPSIHCGGCLRTIERSLAKLDGVTGARANLTTKSVTVRWLEGATPPPIAEKLDAIGHTPHLADSSVGGADKTFDELVRALAVAGFASANIMAFSVSIWSGAGEGFRDLFHLLSAVIALPVLLYSGRVFYRSAWSALRHGHTNMDVPITIGVLLAFAMSFYDMILGGPHAYFDAAVMLLFFLLIGRTLDHVMRAKARSAVADLAKLTAHGATIERGDGSRAYLPVGEIEPGMTILVAAGERIPVNGSVLSGASELDRSLVTGESVPDAITAGAPVEAGTLNLTAPLRLKATATADGSFLAEMVRLMSAAEAGRSDYRRLADRAAGLYAPVVHSAALLAFLGWVFATGDYHRAATIAVAVLIITCPCALGLAVPIVQVIAARRLLESGIMVKDGAGLERLAEADTVVFDKTGTLTAGRPELVGADHVDPDALSLAAALAAHSRHPQSLALVAAHSARGAKMMRADDVHEVPGHGIEARFAGSVVRLGRAEWALEQFQQKRAAVLRPELGENEEIEDFRDSERNGNQEALAGPPLSPRTVLAKDGRLVAAFSFHERPRRGAREAIAALGEAGLGVEILSGDHGATVRDLAATLGVDRFEADARPEGKLTRLKALAKEGRRTFMVGDGLNDAPALAAAHVSMAPSSAVDVGRNAADFVFMREGLEAVPFAFTIARRARRLIRENFGLAVLYNAIALPFAIAGFVTPLAAALAMSGSSLVVVANAMRLSGGKSPGRTGSNSASPRRASSSAAITQPAE